MLSVISIYLSFFLLFPVFVFMTNLKSITITKNKPIFYHFIVRYRNNYKPNPNKEMKTIIFI